MKTEKEEEEYKVKMEELKNFLFLVNVYTSEFYAGFKLSEVISKLDDEILVYEYNKELNIEDLKPLCGFIKKDEDIKKINMRLLMQQQNILIHVKQVIKKLMNIY